MMDRWKAAAVRRWRAATADRDGGYNPLEAAIIVPIFIVFTMMVVQFALARYGRHVAEAAAQAAARSAAVYASTAAVGRPTAELSGPGCPAPAHRPRRGGRPRSAGGHRHGDRDGGLGDPVRPFHRDPDRRGTRRGIRDPPTSSKLGNPPAFVEGPGAVRAVRSIPRDRNEVAVHGPVVHPAAARVAARRPSGDRGSSIIEVAIVTPIVIALLLTMVALGRYSENKILVEQASAAAARAASLTSTPGRPGRRRRPPRRTPCPGRVWPARRCPPGGHVGVPARRAGVGQVTCTADLSQLALIGVPGSASLSYTSTAPLEAFRQFGAG